MNKHGTTLIELMIVIAIMGILYCMPCFQESFRMFKAQEDYMVDQENVFLFTNHLRTLIREAKYIDTAFDRQLILDNLRLIVSKDRSRVFLNGKIWKFKKFTIGNFERVDDMTAICRIDNGANKYSLYIVPGKYEPIVYDDNPEPLSEKNIPQVTGAKTESIEPADENNSEVPGDE